MTPHGELDLAGAADLEGLVLSRLSDRAGVPMIDPAALADPEALVSRIAGGDPLLGMLVRRIVERPVEHGGGESNDAGELEEDAALDAARREAAAHGRLQRLAGRLRSTRAEVEELRSRNDALAAALGACRLCWGEEPQCPRCGGAGAPGGSPPDPEEFTRYVSPTLRSLQLRGARRRGPARPLPAAGETPLLPLERSLP